MRNTASLTLHNSNIIHSGQKVPAPSADDEGEQGEPADTDYPRPPPPGTGEPHQHNQHEEEQPRREKKAHPEYKPQQELYRKVEQNRPKKDIPITKGTAGSRISQPQSKVLNV